MSLPTPGLLCHVLDRRLSVGLFWPTDAVRHSMVAAAGSGDVPKIQRSESASAYAVGCCVKTDRADLSARLSRDVLLPRLASRVFPATVFGIESNPNITRVSPKNLRGAVVLELSGDSTALYSDLHAIVYGFRVNRRISAWCAQWSKRVCWGRH